MTRNAFPGCRFRHRARGGETAPPPVLVPRGPRAAARLGVGERWARRLRHQCTVLPITPVTVAPPPEPEPALVVRVNLLDADSRQCRAIDGADGLCCSRLTTGTSSWCAVHRLRSTSREASHRSAA